MLVIYVSGGLRSSESDVGRGPEGVLVWALMEGGMGVAEACVIVAL